MMGGYGRAKTRAMRMLPKDYADTAKNAVPLAGSARVMARTLLMAHQGL